MLEMILRKVVGHDDLYQRIVLWWPFMIYDKNGLPGLACMKQFEEVQKSWLKSTLTII